LDANHAHGIEADIPQGRRNAVREEVNAAGIELACLATSLRYADPEKTAVMMAQTHERIDLAGDLGVETIRVFGGAIPEGVSREHSIDLLVKTLSDIADHAENRGVTVCLETHDDWCDPAHVAMVMARVNRPGIAVNWDIMHPVRTGAATIDESFEALRPWIRHAHIHDGTGLNVQLVPIGTGDIDHKRVLQLLSSAGYAGYLSGEWINWEEYDVHLPRELATMKRYEQELSQ
jgi:sugar phosphate isomerase/epimerase